MYFSLILEAEKAAQVSKIQFDQKIMEKESLRKMSEIEGELYSWFDVIASDNSNRDARVNKLKEIQNRIHGKQQTRDSCWQFLYLGDEQAKKCPMKPTVINCR